MLRKLKRLFDEHIQPGLASADAHHSEHAVRLATAALLVEMMRADQAIDRRELDSVLGNLQARFTLTADEAQALLEEAKQAADAAVDLHGFTRLLNECMSGAQKRQVIELLWRVAFADGHKDDHEEHLVRKIAGLLYVPHHEFIQARLKAEQDQG